MFSSLVQKAATKRGAIANKSDILVSEPIPTLKVKDQINQVDIDGKTVDENYTSMKSRNKI